MRVHVAPMFIGRFSGMQTEPSGSASEDDEPERPAPGRAGGAGDEEVRESPHATRGASGGRASFGRVSCLNGDFGGSDMASGLLTL